MIPENFITFYEKTRPRLHRFCNEERGGCGKRFLPNGKFQKFCNECILRKQRMRIKKRQNVKQK